MTESGLQAIERIAVGSTNPVKLGAARSVLSALAPNASFDAISVASGVPDQPWGDEETIRGATTRAGAARDALGADLGIGIEGGVVSHDDGSLSTCAWAVVVDRTGKKGVGGSLAMPLPPAVAALIRDGVELGHAMDIVSGTHNTKHGAGAVGILTAGLVDRQRAYEIILTYALAPWLGAALW
jgi:inosine/xanthosine triphosphatase